MTEGFWGGAGYIKSTKKLHERHEYDFYPTPARLCQVALDVTRHLNKGSVTRILDPGAGTGEWGKAARAMYWSADIEGVEIRPDAAPCYAYDRWCTEDFLAADQRTAVYDRIIGNPPYGIKEKGKEYIPLAEPFVR